MIVFELRFHSQGRRKRNDASENGNVTDLEHGDAVPVKCCCVVYVHIDMV